MDLYSIFATVVEQIKMHRTTFCFKACFRWWVSVASGFWKAPFLSIKRVFITLQRPRVA